jgi:hypothetical protein
MADDIMGFGPDTAEVLIQGDDVGISAAISALELLEKNTTSGERTLAAGE